MRCAGRSLRGPVAWRQERDEQAGRAAERAGRSREDYDQLAARRHSAQRHLRSRRRAQDLRCQPRPAGPNSAHLSTPPNRSRMSSVRPSTHSRPTKDCCVPAARLLDAEPAEPGGGYPRASAPSLGSRPLGPSLVGFEALDPDVLHADHEAVEPATPPPAESLFSQPPEASAQAPARRRVNAVDGASAMDEDFLAALDRRSRSSDADV